MLTYIDLLPREIRELLERYVASPSYRVKVEPCEATFAVVISYPDLVVRIRLYHQLRYRMEEFLSDKNPYPYPIPSGGTMSLRGNYLIYGTVEIRLSPELRCALLEAEERTQSSSF